MYAFIHIEKTAGSTLTAILRRSFGTRHCDVRLPLAKRRHHSRARRACVDAADLNRVQRLYRNLCGIAGHYVTPYSELARQCPGLRYFTFLRDPSARFRSHYLNRTKTLTEAAFEEWISGDWSHNWQTRMLAGEQNAEKAIALINERVGFVGLTEQFDESVVMLGDWLGEPSFRGEYRPANQLSKKHRAKELAERKEHARYLDTPSVRARIAEANAEDQKVYDFVRSTVFPRQVAAHRGDLPSNVRWLQQRNREVGLLMESLWAGFLRNFVYEPLVRWHAM
jgi:hypothetical protein